MPSFSERLRALSLRTDAEAKLAELTEQRWRQAELESERINRRKKELEEKVRRKFAKQILSEVNEGFCNGRGEIYTLNEGRKIDFPDSYYKDGMFHSHGMSLKGPCDFILWDRKGNSKRGSVHCYQLNTEVPIPRETDLFSQEIERTLLSETTKNILEERVIEHFTKNPYGETIGWSNVIQHTNYDNA